MNETALATLEHERALHKALIEEAVQYLSNTEENVLLPVHRASLLRYLEERIETGGFLRACLENDFFRAIAHCNPLLTVRDLKHIQWALSTFPEQAWGSAETVQAWLNQKGSTPDVDANL